MTEVETQKVTYLNALLDAYGKMNDIYVPSMDEKDALKKKIFEKIKPAIDNL